MRPRSLFAVVPAVLVLATSCTSDPASGSGPGAGGDGGTSAAAERAIYDSLVLLSPGAEERPAANEDSSVTVPMGGGTGQDIEPGETITVVLPFNAPEGNVVGAGVRFSPTGPFKFIPMPSVQGQSSGTIRFQMQVSQNVCGSLSSICHSIKCYEFAVTSAGTISRANIMQLALACNDCSEPSCKDLLQQCSSDGASFSCKPYVDDTPSPPTVGTCSEQLLAEACNRFGAPTCPNTNAAQGATFESTLSCICRREPDLRKCCLDAEAAVDSRSWAGSAPGVFSFIGNHRNPETGVPVFCTMPPGECTLLTDPAEKDACQKIVNDLDACNAPLCPLSQWNAYADACEAESGG